MKIVSKSFVFFTLSLILLSSIVMAAQGAIWTTRGGCSIQDENHYGPGEEVWINGNNFNSNTLYSWDITGKPGGASCDPNTVIASGSFSTDGDGNVCFYAYTISGNDCGEYTATYGGKSDNYGVDCVDHDNDGYNAGPFAGCETGNDCDDSNPNVNPGATEVCDNDIDDDCDGLIDCLDSDCIGDPSCFVCIDFNDQSSCLLNSCYWCSECDSPFSNINYPNGNCVDSVLECVWNGCEIGCGADCESNSDCSSYCDGGVRSYDGLCDSQCSCSYSTEDCDSYDGCYDYNSGCEDRDYYCTITSCDYSYSNRNEDSISINEYCYGDIVRESTMIYDYQCDSVCTEDFTGLVEDIKNCDDQDGWYDTGLIKWEPLGQCNEKEMKEQEYRDYYCDVGPVDCYYTVTDNQWVETGHTGFVDDGTICNDGLFCTVGDQCTFGVCSGILRDCSGLDDQCNVGFCDEEIDQCVLDPTPLNGNPCDDGLFCNVQETCQDGLCGGGSARVCEDSVGCTDDSCNEQTDSCENTPNDVYCNDDNICTDDVCDAYDGCQNNFNTDPCDDGLWCTIDDVCGSGQCLGSQRDCSGNDITEVAACGNDPDSNPLTWDFRNPFTSQCVEDGGNTGHCTTGDDTVTSECDYDQCGADCDATHDCDDKECEETFDDYCSGNQLIEYDSDKILDSTTVSDSCTNSCLGDCTCTDCSTDCSAPATSTYCVSGVCGAECDSDDDCQYTECDYLDGCYGKDYYDYDDVDNTCLGDCMCTDNSCANPSISYNDIRCSVCGDGVVDTGEECDIGSDVQGDCCDANCYFESSSYVCGPSQGECDLEETCTGSSAECPSDQKSVDECRSSLGECDVAEYCDGVNNDCPIDSFLPNTTVCRVSAGLCDIEEMCTGDSAFCPADSLRPFGYVCDQDDGECEADDICDGQSATCDEIYADSGIDCGVCAACDGLGACSYDETQDSDCVPTLCLDSCDIDSNPFTWDYANDVPNQCADIGICTQNDCQYDHVCHDCDMTDGIGIELDQRCCAPCDQDEDCGQTTSYCDYEDMIYYTRGSYGTCDDSCQCTESDWTAGTAEDYCLNCNHCGDGNVNCGEECEPEELGERCLPESASIFTCLNGVSYEFPEFETCEDTCVFDGCEQVVTPNDPRCDETPEEPICDNCGNNIPDFTMPEIPTYTFQIPTYTFTKPTFSFTRPVFSMPTYDYSSFFSR